MSVVWPQSNGSAPWAGGQFDPFGGLRQGQTADAALGRRPGTGSAPDHLAPQPMKMNHLLQAPLLLLAVAAAGCHTVSSALIVPENVAVSRAVGGSVQIAASGSQKQGHFGPPIVAADDLEAALTEVILSCGLYDEVLSGAGARHLLEVEVVELVEPEVGFDTSTEVTLRWTLKSGDGDRTLWVETITTSASLNSYEEMDSSLRPQLVMEKAMRDNLAEGIRALSAAAPTAP